MKPISRTIFKRSKNVKNYIIRWDDDSISVRTLWLTDKRIKGVHLLTKKFGKFLQDRISQRFSKETIGLFINILEQPINKNGMINQTVKLIER